jgi:gamma-glutamyltranspeptidase / glutathione hydrolase
MKQNDLEYPYASRRTVVYSAKGIVAASQHLAAQAGLDALKKGGNAIDAAVAAAACLTVVEPCSNGIGGDAFAIVWHGGKMYGLNSSGPAPSALTAEKVRALGLSAMPNYGWEPVTVPGAPAAWAALTQRFGKRQLCENVEQAAQYAQEGFPVSPDVSQGWNSAAGTYREKLNGEMFKPWFDTFTADGKAPQCGEIFRLPMHAGTLREIGRTCARSFYQGELAEKIVSFAKDTGGYLSLADLEGFRPEWVNPVSAGYRGHEIWELPPNGHGIVALMALNMLEGFEPAPRGDGNTLHRQVEAVKLAFADGLEYIADPDSMKPSIEEMLSAGYAARRRALIGENAAMPAPGTFADHGTVYLATADGEGNMVSYIQSNYMGFGSGLVVPGTGIALHDRGANFSLDPNHANCLTPGKRPYHTIIPGFITCGGQAVGPFGVMGGFMQPQGHVQVVVNMLDSAMNPQAALDCPRWRWNQMLDVSLEEGFEPGLAQSLAERGHAVGMEPSGGSFGRGQIILRQNGGALAAGTDKRADSAAAAW